jgi:GT2 family glycosyltransferase
MRSQSALELSIVIVNWNTRRLLLECLDSIARHPASRRSEIWVVDNGSTDGSIEAVRARHPLVRLIANSENIGFAAANNQAIAASRGRYVLLLNSDTAVLPGALDGLCEYLDAHQRVGAVGSRLLNADGSTQRSCWRGYPGLLSAIVESFYLWRLMPSVVAPTEVAVGDHLTSQSVDHLLGACILVRRIVVERVGALDACYFLFLEDTDWCRRIRMAGWQIMYLPESRVVHLGQQSMRQCPTRTLPASYASLCMFVRRGGGSWLTPRLLLLKSILALNVLLRLGLWSLRFVRQPVLSRRMLAGYARVLCRLPWL